MAPSMIINAIRHARIKTLYLAYLKKETEMMIDANAGGLLY